MNFYHLRVVQKGKKQIAFEVHDITGQIKRISAKGALEDYGVNLQK